METPEPRRLNVVLIFSVVAIVALIILFVMFVRSLGGDPTDPQSLFSQNNRVSDVGSTAGGVPRVSAADHARGAANPSVIWIEYGDFECPFCKLYHPEIKKLLAEYPEDVQVVFRHFPLEIHENAFEKSHATECVADLGGEDKFWQYHDMLYDRADTNGLGISVEQLTDFAAELGVNRIAFDDCMESLAFRSRINGDIATGAAAGVTGTPSTVIVTPDGAATLIEGVVEFESMKEIMEFLMSEYASGT